MLALQPVFELHVTVPVMSCGFAPLDFFPPLTFPYSPVTVAVNVIGVA